MRKVFLTITLILSGFYFYTLKVTAVSNPYNKNFGSEINCTWFAWQQAYDKAGVALPGWGNANTWFNSAKNAGYETGMTPKVNSIVVWEWNNLGHVGYVERVYGDYIYVWDSVNPDGCPAEMPDLYHCWDEHTLEEVDNGACKDASRDPHGCAYSKTYWHKEGDLIGYIYLDNAPKTPISNVTSNQSIVTITPVKKSNNANLSNININNIDFKFNKETLEYNLEVENSIENIKIEATLEDNKSKVEGVGEQKLVIGENTMSLKVTAEDGTEKTYIIKIKRKDNNAYLSNLIVSDVDFKFDKETLKYELTIPRSIENITITGSTESSLATIDGLGNYDLLEEENIIKIIVTAEDETNKTYTITLIKEPKKFSQKMNTWIIIGISIMLLTILTFVITYNIKKRKNIDNKKIKKEKTK